MPTTNQDLRFLEKVTAVAVRFGNLSFTKKLPKSAVTTESDPERVSASKRLLDCPEADAIRSEFTRIRQFVTARTLPSPFGKGVYFVPNTRLEEVDNELDNAKKVTIPALGEALIAVYDIVLDKERTALGPNFAVTDYDTPAEIRERLSVEFSYMTFGVPQNLPEQILSREAEKQRQRLVESVDVMQTLLRNEMAKLVEHAIDKLSGTKDNGKKSSFKNSLVGNIREFLALFADRNITDDTEMKALCDKAAQLLEGVDPQDLRDKEPLRESVARGFAEIKQALDGMLVPRGSRVITFEDEPEPAEVAA